MRKPAVTGPISAEVVEIVLVGRLARLPKSRSEPLGLLCELASIWAIFFLPRFLWRKEYVAPGHFCCQSGNKSCQDERHGSDRCNAGRFRQGYGLSL